MRRMTLIVTGCVFSLAACKDPPPPAPPPAPPEAKPVAEPEPTAPPTAPSPTTIAPAPSPTAAAAPIAIQAVIADGAKFQFSIKESPDAFKLQTERCTAEAKGDAAKAKACLEEVEKESVTEGIRFEKEGDKLLWVSYGIGKDGKEETYLRGPIALLDAPADELHFQPAGEFTGKQAAGIPTGKLPPDKFMTVKAIDAKTIVMQSPPPKGALTYHKQ